MKSLKSRFDTIRNNPHGEYKALSRQINLASGELPDIEDLLCLLFAGVQSGSSREVQNLADMCVTHPEYKSFPEYSYYLLDSLGYFYYLAQNFPDALELLHQALDSAYRIDDPDPRIWALSHISSVYRKVHDFESERYYIEEAIQIADKSNNAHLLSDLWISYGIVLMNQDEFENSIRSLEIAKKFHGQIKEYESTLGYSILLLKMAQVSHKMGRRDEAEELYRQGFDLARANGHEKLLIRAHRDFSEYLADGKLYDDAYRHLSIYVERHEEARINKLSIEKTRSQMEFTFSGLSELTKKNEILIDRLANLYDRIDREDIAINDTLISILNNEDLQKLFVPFFQGKWTMPEGRLCGAEVLVRWKLEDGTLLSPDSFLSLIEDSEVMNEITSQLLAKSLPLYKEIRESIAPGFSFSYNVSPKQLMHHDMGRFFEKELFIHNAAAEGIEIELTESTFIEDNPHVHQQMQALHALGLPLSLDDFGSGYSSMYSLNAYPFSIVKIDKTLVSGCDTSVRGHNLLSGIYRLIQELEKQVVFEGVETEGEYRTVKKIGPGLIQGYYFSKPLPGAEFMQLLNAQKDRP